MRWRRWPGGTVRAGAAADFARPAARRRLRSERFDVVVVGGGVTGCGVALDAAARRLRAALVEADDFASGTSSRSSKLVHGGLRYLQHREFGLVYEALAERQRLLHNAPHLVRALPFVVPLYSRGRAERFYSTALWLYDLTGGLRIGRAHRRLPPADAVRHAPGLEADRVVTAFEYWDAQADDARLTLALARTAGALGAVVLNHAPAKELLSAPDGRLRGVRLADGTEVEAAVVVNAGGVWSDEIAALDPGSPPIGLRPAKGVHVTVPASRLPCDRAVILPLPDGHGTVFVVPWDAAGARRPDEAGRFTYIGTTDTEYHGDRRAPVCTPDDVARLLDAVNARMSVDLTPADVTGCWAGLRPLLKGTPDAATADLSRRHRVLVSPTGLVTVTGGKLTTYRRMAADTVDAVQRILDRRVTPSPTARLRLVGAGRGPEARPGAGRVPGVLGVPMVRDHLWRRFGVEAPAVAALADADPTLAEPLVPGLPYLRAEAVWAVRSEMAASLTDVLARRTRAVLLDRRAAIAAAPAVAELIGGELGWSAERRDAEVATFAALATADDTGVPPLDALQPAGPATGTRPGP